MRDGSVMPPCRECLNAERVTDGGTFVSFDAHAEGRHCSTCNGTGREPETMMSQAGLDLVKKFFNGKNVLITGHTGFKGSWLSVWLHTMGARLHGYAKDWQRNSLYEQAGLGSLFESYTLGLIEDSMRVVGAFDTDAPPDVVFHFAAQSQVHVGYEQPMNTFTANVMGTVNVLESCRLAKTPTVVLATSDKCYKHLGNGEPHHEDSRIGGSDPYSASKAAAEMVIEGYRYYMPQLAWVRAGNIIGGGDRSSYRLLPDFWKSFLTNQPLEIRYAEAVRPWQYVLDALYGYMLIAARGKVGPWNLGPSSKASYTVLDIVNKANETLQSCGHNKIEIRVGESKMPPETRVLELSSTKAREKLGWKALFDAPRAVQATVQLDKRLNVFDKTKSRANMRADITDYEQLLCEAKP